MGLPQPVAAALDEMETEAQTAARSPLEGATAHFERVADDLAACLSRLEKATKSVVAAGDRWIAELQGAGAPLGADALDEAIESLRDHEERLAEIAEPGMESGRAILKHAFQAPRSWRARAHRLSTKAIKVHAEAVEAVRDMRWRLLAVRAVAEDQGDHPVLESAEDLETYLDRVL
jgi:hypothetical protein